MSDGLGLSLNPSLIITEILLKSVEEWICRIEKLFMEGEITMTLKMSELQTVISYIGGTGGYLGNLNFKCLCTTQFKHNSDLVLPKCKSDC